MEERWGLVVVLFCLGLGMRSLGWGGVCFELRVVRCDGCLPWPWIMLVSCTTPELRTAMANEEKKDSASLRGCVLDAAPPASSR
jgi:hypothetical protein